LAAARENANKFAFPLALHYLCSNKDEDCPYCAMRNASDVEALRLSARLAESIRCLFGWHTVGMVDINKNRYGHQTAD
jgi:hypothetical protein